MGSRFIEMRYPFHCDVLKMELSYRDIIVRAFAAEYIDNMFTDTVSLGLCGSDFRT